jgi:hypothetical protein
MAVGHVRLGPHVLNRDRRPRPAGVRVLSVDFWGRHRRRPVLVSGIHANFRLFWKAVSFKLPTPLRHGEKTRFQVQT